LAITRPTPSLTLKSQLILFGANDACLPACPTQQHVPLDRYRANLKRILTHPSVTAHNPTIFLVTPPPINEAHLEAEDLKKNQGLTREQAVTQKYAEAVRDVAREVKDDQDVVLVDLWKVLMAEAQRLTEGYKEGDLLGSRETGDNQALRGLLCDGLHLTKEGYELFLKEVVKHVGMGWEYEPASEPSWVFP
jgi:lysophospholipase L1-like esterase